MRTKFSILLFTGLLSGFLFSCKKDTETVTVTNPMYNLRGNATGKQEVPSNASTGTATLTGTYNRDNNTMNYTVNFSGLTGGNASAAHFHGNADPGVAAPVLITFTGFPAATSGTYTNTATLTDAQETDLFNGLWYFNIHNATYPGGEIRGQVIMVPQ